MEYRIKIAPEYDDFYTWNKLYRDKIMHGFTSMTKLLLIVCAVVLFVCALLLVRYHAFSVGYIAVLLLYAVFAAYFFSAYKLYTKWGMKLYEKRGFSEAVFCDEGIVCRYKSSEKKLTYSDIRAVFETDSCFYLMPLRSFAIILNKKNIEDSNAFSKLLSEKTRLKAEKIN